MFRLVYFSSATRPFAKDELLALLEQSRTRNATQDITGLLLYKDGNFLQLLEGEETRVRGLMAHIAKDPRHSGLIVLIEEAVPARLFQDWSMGFRDLSDPEVLALPGFNDYMNRRHGRGDLPDDPSDALDLMQVFREGR